MTTAKLTERELQTLCANLTSTVGDAITWFQTHPDLPPGQREGLVRELKAERRELHRLQRTSMRPMCVAVFGPSQVGKSYLISSLAKRRDEPLLVRFEDRVFNFLEELNPEGEGTEATGLVTRFTARATQTPPGFPVHVKLHSLTDVVKIIANTYFLDFAVDVEVDRAPSEQEVHTLIERARGKLASGSEATGLSEDEVLDLKDYVREKFRGRQTEKLLDDTGYWDSLAEFAGRLPADEWGGLLALLWGRNERLTGLFTLIRDGLAEVGYASEAFCALDALLERKRSIININALDDLGKSQLDAVPVAVPGGRQTKLPRALLTAIIAELVLTLDEPPYDYFKYTDLLDFPGYRPRFQETDLDSYVARPDAFRELFRRGKVDFLFDAYCREQEITALLLCSKPGNQNTHAIPRLIKRWVHETHGATPQERQGALNALFVIRTMFDMRFPSGAGSKADSDERWRNAIEREHLEFLGKTISWPKEWSPRTPFRQIFWIRDPQFQAHNLILFDEDNKESGLRDPDNIAVHKSTYLANELVQTYVEDAERKWDEVMRLNDGGVSYLAEKLTPVCNPTIKAEQVRVRLMAAIERLKSRMMRYHVGDDRQAEIDKRIAATENVIDIIFALAENERFAHLINRLQIESEELRRALFKVFMSGGKSTEAKSEAVTSRREKMRRVMGRGRAQRNEDVPDEPSSGSSERSLLAANAAMEFWSRHANEAMEDSVLADIVADERESLGLLSAELVDAARRNKLDKQIARRLEAFTTGFENAEDARDKLALIAAEEINTFVWTLGFDRVPPDQRPVTYDENNRPVPIFQRNATSVDEVDFDSDVSFADVFVAEWCTGYQETVKANAHQAEDSTVDRARNEALGQLIKDVDAAEKKVDA